MKIYPSIMKMIILPAAGVFSDISIWDEYRKMIRTERFSFEELEYLQFLKLKRILQHANDKVPFYRRRFRDISFIPDNFLSKDELRFIPPTTKEDIMDNFPEEITAREMDRNKWKYVATSGTTRQIMGIHDFRKANLNWAAGMRAHKLAGNHDIGERWMEIPPHMCTNICGSNDDQKSEKLLSRKTASLLLRADIAGLKEFCYKYAHSKRQNLYKRVTLPSFGSEGTNIPEPEIESYLDRIGEYKPYLLEGLPLYLYAFAKHLHNLKKAPPQVAVIKPFGGSLTPHMKRTISESFNCEVFDTYGCSETGFIACDCEKHDGLHLFMDLYHVEICRNGIPVAPGELGKIYITDLENIAMPWIRYDIGDVGRYFVDDHGCGRHSIRLHVEGRVQDTLSNSKGEFFTSDQVFDFFHMIGEIDNFQLLERSQGRFDLLCVPKNGSKLDRERVAVAFRKFFDEEASVKVYPVKTIKAEDGGKFRSIKSKSYEKI